MRKTTQIPKKYLKAFFLCLLAIAAMLAVFALQSRKQKSDVMSPLPEQQIDETESLPADSIPKMAQREYNGSDLKLVKVLSRNNYFTRYAVTYQSEGFTISGTMNVPVGKGPFPILILNHGYFDPREYQSGQALRREQTFFASHGYVTLLSDYRGYGYSNNDANNDSRPRSGYVEDVLNAVAAVKSSNLKFIDRQNVGMLGHSMGGGITLNVMVTKPDTAKAYVLLAPISSDYKVNFDTWVKDYFPSAAQQFYAQYGTYEQNPRVWESFSAKNYFDRIDAPILLQQGTADQDVPVQWSRDLAGNLRKAGKQITYYEYPGEGHVFMSAQDVAMQRTLKFFDQNLKKK